MINDWCQQFPSHSIGTLKFGSDGYLYAGAGEGANFNTQDWGQFGATYSGDKANPCGDPPGTVGTALTPPTAEGGALRSQSVRRTDGPATLDGTIFRIDPSTGGAAPGNPFAGSSDANKARVIAYGLRNPFRFTPRPGTNELWIGEVGAGTWEEIDRIPSAVDTVAENFGWPCYEGIDRSSYQAFGLNLCGTLYSLGNAVSPYYAYNHDNAVVSGDGCPTANGSSITGIAFYAGATYPGADYLRLGANGPEILDRMKLESPCDKPIGCPITDETQLPIADHLVKDGPRPGYRSRATPLPSPTLSTVSTQSRHS